MVSSYLTNVEDNRLLIIDAYKWQLTPIYCAYTDFFKQGTEDDILEKLRADERKRAEEAEKAKAISTTKKPVNRIGTMQSQNQSAPSRRCEKGTISISFYISEINLITWFIDSDSQLTGISGHVRTRSLLK